MNEISTASGKFVEDITQKFYNKCTSLNRTAGTQKLSMVKKVEHGEKVEAIYRGANPILLGGCAFEGPSFHKRA